MRHEKGFTLIELLVVISIIALLVAILLPALNRAREQAKTLVCETNLRQLVTAWHMYGDDNEDHIPGSWNNTPLRHGAGKPWDWAWAPWRLDGPDDESGAIPIPGNRLPDSCTVQERMEGIRRGAMFKYSGHEDIHHCPSDKINFRSYSMPDSLAGHWGASGGWKVIMKRAELTRPSERYLLLEECDSRGYNMNAWVLDMDQIRFWDPLTVWHFGGSNLGFADGHVENHKWSPETTEYFMGYKKAFLSGYTPITAASRDDVIYLQRAWPQ